MAAYIFVATKPTADATMNHSYFLTYKKVGGWECDEEEDKINKKNFTSSVSGAGFCSTPTEAYIEIPNVLWIS